MGVTDRALTAAREQEPFGLAGGFDLAYKWKHRGLHGITSLFTSKGRPLEYPNAMEMNREVHSRRSGFYNGNL